MCCRLPEPDRRNLEAGAEHHRDSHRARSQASTSTLGPNGPSQSTNSSTEAIQAMGHFHCHQAKVFHCLVSKATTLLLGVPPERCGPERAEMPPRLLLHPPTLQQE